MSEKQTFILAHRAARQSAMRAISYAPDGFVVQITEPNKTRLQEEKYHAMFGDIAKQAQFMGSKRDVETWKRLLVDAFARAKAAMGEPIQGQGGIIPNLDGTGFVQLGVQTRKFRKKEAIDFVDYLYAWGAENGIRWAEPMPLGYEEMTHG
ncbi:recombination protein NinB [Robbsia andropogonis]|uniref:recombination protein NinB n=1 Tax=Robbsia andropogonis TaxID=28092 RepID=UPI003D24CB0F